MRNSPFSRRTCAGLQEIVAIILIGHFAVSAAAQTKPPAPQIQQFLGTWTAVHAGTPIIVLHLRLKEGKLAGDVQVCSYTISANDRQR